jgi:hypothetical protein
MYKDFPELKVISTYRVLSSTFYSNVSVPEFSSNNKFCILHASIYNDDALKCNFELPELQSLRVRTRSINEAIKAAGELQLLGYKQIIKFTDRYENSMQIRQEIMVLVDSSSN